MESLGHFLQQDHTVEHLRTELWRSKLLTRQAYEDWEKSGSKDMYQRIQEKLEDIIENHQVASLPAKALDALAQIKERGEKELNSQQT